MTSFSRISVEIAISVFQSLDDLQDVKALLSVNTKVFSIWTENAAVILSTVLPRAIPFYPLAKSFREFEKRASGHQPCTLVYPSVEDAREMVKTAKMVELYGNEYKLDSRSIARGQITRSIYSLWISQEEDHPVNEDKTRKYLLNFFIPGMKV